jgi:hypothetical protein
MAVNIPSIVAEGDPLSAVLQAAKPATRQTAKKNFFINIILKVKP